MKRWKDENVMDTNFYENLEHIIERDCESNKQTDHAQALTILRIQEEERRRVSMELHDISLQNLAHLIHKVELCSLCMDRDPAQAKFELAGVSSSLRNIIDEMRGIIFDLRPIDFGENGIREDIERLIYKMNEQNRFFVKTDIDDIIFQSHITQVSVYRIIKECVNNALRYSEGNQLSLSLKAYGYLCEITIRDNGIGFDIERVHEKRGQHFGLSVVQERIRLLDGTWKIESTPDKGTTITITVPYRDAKRNDRFL
jgi:two-component system sensor histidine kinase DegS